MLRGMRTSTRAVVEVLVAVTVLSACRPGPAPAGAAAQSQASQPSQAALPAKAGAGANVEAAAIGAAGDGQTDDRAALQAVIDRAAAGTGDVSLPAGTFVISSNKQYGLKIPGGVRLHGAGQDKTILLQAPGFYGGARTLFVTGPGITIADLTLDGNKQAQAPSEQRHGLMAVDTSGLRLERVTARNHTGDGFYLYTGANNSTLVNVLSTGNDRNGITMGGMIDGTVLMSSKFIANKAQQVDSEPGRRAEVSNTWVIDNDIDGGGVSNEYVLTCSGTETDTRGHGWTVIGNRINGGIFVVWAENVVIAGNTGVNPTNKASVVVYRSSVNVTIMGNHFTQSGARVAGVAILGTKGGGPARVTVAENTIETTNEQGFGVQAQGARSVVIKDNVLRGSGRPARGYAGVALRATNPASDFESAVVTGNRISNFGAYGVQIMGNGTAKLLSVDIRNNTFDDNSAAPSMTEGISLDDGTGAAQQISVVGNKYLGGVTAEVTNYPQTVPVLVEGVRGSGAVYSVAGSPEGAMAETVGAKVIRRDAGPGPKYYVKLSGKGTKTGWAPREAPP
jgi:hypothetical protein